MLLVYFGGSFLMHLVWEMAQMPLYALADVSWWDGFKMCLFATATGDMLFMLILCGTVATIQRKPWWLSDRSAYSHPATWAVPALIGALFAVSYELWAVHAVHRWTYGAMPLIPVVKVGLTPVLQMIVIPLAITALCRWIASWDPSVE
jgi:hypothetical protein